MSGFEVIVVDDDLETAEAFAEYISKVGNVPAVAYAKPDAALDAVRKFPIKVAVLDQKMPDMMGTELYAEILKIRPEVRAIMLSGQAERADVSAALSLKYVADIEKGKPDKLVDAVHKALIQARTEKLIHIDPPKLLGEKIFLWLWLQARYYLTFLEILSEPYVPDDLWKLDGQISAGETRTVRYSRTVDEKLIVDQSFLTKQSASVGFSVSEIGKLQGKIHAELEQRTGIKLEGGQSTSESMETTLTLPQEPTDPTENVVKARGFYSGPEYVSLRLGIRVEHLRIRESIDYEMDILFHTGYFVGKQVDTLTDGTKMVRETNRWR